MTFCTTTTADVVVCVYAFMREYVYVKVFARRYFYILYIYIYIHIYVYIYLLFVMQEFSNQPEDSGLLAQLGKQGCNWQQPCWRRRNSKTRSIHSVDLNLGPTPLIVGYYDSDRARIEFPFWLCGYCKCNAMCGRLTQGRSLIIPAIEVNDYLSLDLSIQNI